jgi:methylmalonyl-CoA/ethylmalonyl-CoA epimerase
VIEALGGRPVGQVGIVVRDLDRALERYAAAGPWHCYTYGPETVPELRFRGGPGRFAMRIALAGERPQLELIEPLTGPSLYEEWLEAHGEGVQHLGIHVPSLAEAVASMEAAGYAVLQLGSGYGLDGDGGFAYFDTAREFGVVLEAIEVPRRRREPERVWP